MRPGGWGPHGGINAESLLLASLYYVRTYQEVSTWGLLMTRVSCIGRWVVYLWDQLGSPHHFTLSLSLSVYLNHHMVHIKLMLNVICTPISKTPKF